MDEGSSKSSWEVELKAKFILVQKKFFWRPGVIIS